MPHLTISWQLSGIENHTPSTFIICQTNTARSIADMNQELTGIHHPELAKHRDRKRHYAKSMRTSRAPWKDAERLITLVEAQHRRSTKFADSWLLFFEHWHVASGHWTSGINLQIILAFFQRMSLTSCCLQSSLPGDGLTHRYGHDRGRADRSVESVWSYVS